MKLYWPRVCCMSFIMWTQNPVQNTKLSRRVLQLSHYFKYLWRCVSKSWSKPVKLFISHSLHLLKAGKKKKTTNSTMGCKWGSWSLFVSLRSTASWDAGGHNFIALRRSEQNDHRRVTFAPSDQKITLSRAEKTNKQQTKATRAWEISLTNGVSATSRKFYWLRNNSRLRRRQI